MEELHAALKQGTGLLNSKALNLNKAGFTIIELAVVVAIIGTFAVMLLPSIGRAKQKALEANCLNNLKQLQLGWIMYSGANQERLAPAGGTDSFITTKDPAFLMAGATNSQWVYGRVDTGSSAADPWFVENGLIYPYVKNTAAYKCPADQRTVQGQTTVRSYSMNCWLNPINAYHPTTEQIYRKISDLSKPGPSSLFVFIDEASYSIDDGYFVCSPKENQWINNPATRHGHGCGVSFADGHAEIKVWKDAKLLAKNKTSTLTGPPCGPGNSDDLNWLQQRSTFVP